MHLNMREFLLDGMSCLGAFYFVISILSRRCVKGNYCDVGVCNNFCDSGDSNSESMMLLAHPNS